MSNDVARRQGRARTVKRATRAALSCETEPISWVRSSSSCTSGSAKSSRAALSGYRMVSVQQDRRGA